MNGIFTISAKTPGRTPCHGQRAGRKVTPHQTAGRRPPKQRGRQRTNRPRPPEEMEASRSIQKHDKMERAIRMVPSETWDRAPGPGAKLAQRQSQGLGPKGSTTGGPEAHPEARQNKTCNTKGPRWNVGPGPGPRGRASPGAWPRPWAKGPRRLGGRRRTQKHDMEERAIRRVPGGTWDRAPGPGAELARGPGQGPRPRGPGDWGAGGAPRSTIQRDVQYEGSQVGRGTGPRAPRPSRPGG